MKPRKQRARSQGEEEIVRSEAMTEDGRSHWSGGGVLLNVGALRGVAVADLYLST